MSQGEVGPVGEAPAAALPPRVKRRSVFGKIGLALAVVPYIVLLMIFCLRPG